jgi:hypothetical protein
MPQIRALNLPKLQPNLINIPLQRLGSQAMADG